MRYFLINFLICKIFLFVNSLLVVHIIPSPRDILVVLAATCLLAACYSTATNPPRCCCNLLLFLGGILTVVYLSFDWCWVVGFKMPVICSFIGRMLVVSLYFLDTCFIHFLCLLRMK